MAPHTRSHVGRTFAGTTSLGWTSRSATLILLFVLSLVGVVTPAVRATRQDKPEGPSVRASVYDGRYDDTSSSIIYNGNLTTCCYPWPRASNSTVKWATTAGSSAKLYFTGSRITRVYTMASNRGSETVLLTA